MAKGTISTPINLRSFSVVEGNVSVSSIESDFRWMMEWMRKNQDSYYSSDFDNLATRIIEDGLTVSGSANSSGRKLGVTPPEPCEYNSFNMAEMFRANVVSKLGAYILGTAVDDVVADIKNPTPRAVADEYRKRFPRVKTPPTAFIRSSIRRLETTGTTCGTPRADGILPLWATDTHFAKTKKDGRNLFLTMRRMPNSCGVTLKFEIPAGERFNDGKITRPTVHLDRKNRLVFSFCIETPKPKPLTPETIMGVDLGIVKPFTASITTDSNNYIIIPNKSINRISRKINSLKKLSARLYDKHNLNIDNNHLEKAETLRIEHLRVRSKISRLKVERAHYIANQIVDIAQKHSALIVLENLAWVPNSKWDQSRQQTCVEDAAKRRGVPVRKVNPKNTSQTCWRCGDKIRHSKRMTVCGRCHKKIDRDILAARNIAAKARNRPTYWTKFQQLSAQTRVSKPETPVIECDRSQAMEHIT